MICGFFFRKCQEISPLQIASGVPSRFLLNEFHWIFPLRYNDRDVKLTTRLHQVFYVENERSYTFTPSHVFVEFTRTTSPKRTYEEAIAAYFRVLYRHFIECLRKHKITLAVVPTEIQPLISWIHSTVQQLDRVSKPVPSECMP